MPGVEGCEDGVCSAWCPGEGARIVAATAPCDPAAADVASSHLHAATHALRSASPRATLSTDAFFAVYSICKSSERDVKTIEKLSAESVSSSEALTPDAASNRSNTGPTRPGVTAMSSESGTLFLPHIMTA